MTINKQLGLVILTAAVISLAVSFLSISLWRPRTESILPTPPSSTPTYRDAALTSNYSVKFTAGTYDGNLGGLDKANSACQVEFPGYSFCSQSALQLMGGGLPDPIAYINPFVGGWVNPDKTQSGNCSDWRDNSGELKGSRFFANGSTASRWWIMSESDRKCSDRLPLCCYRLTP